MLHQNDLIFCKTESGLTSCGYNISNMLLKNTLHMPNSQYSNIGSGRGKDDVRIAKLMEDLVVPSGLYYCHPMSKHKVFNYKHMQPQPQPQLQQSQSPRDKGEKDEKDVIDITNGMLDESMYDKLLSLVSMDKRKHFDKKTRKNKGAIFQKIKDGSMASAMDVDVDVDVPTQEKGEKTNKKKSMKLKINTEKLQESHQEKQKPNNRKTKKVRFAVSK